MDFGQAWWKLHHFFIIGTVLDAKGDSRYYAQNNTQYSYIAYNSIMRSDKQTMPNELTLKVYNICLLKCKSPFTIPWIKFANYVKNQRSNRAHQTNSSMNKHACHVIHKKNSLLNSNTESWTPCYIQGRCESKGEPSICLRCHNFRSRALYSSLSYEN
jgi:hypothetical protein